MKTKPLHRIRNAAAGMLAAAALVVPALAGSSNWTATGSGNFTDSLNWSAGVPGASTGNSSTDIATFQRSVITANGNVTMDAPRNLGGITFDNNATSGGALSYNVLGNATTAITLSPNAVIQNTGSGNLSQTNMVDASLLLAGNASISNSYLTSIFYVGASAGTSVNTISTEANLGNVALTFGGTSSASNLFSLRITQGTGTTLTVIKDGTGTWQLNGSSSLLSSFTGGLKIINGVATLGRNNAINNNAVTLGDVSGSNSVKLTLGSSVTVSGPITVPSGSSGTATIDRLGGSGPGAISGNIILQRDLIIGQNGNNSQLFTISGNVIGTGNLNTKSLLGTGNLTFSNSVNMIGAITNDGISTARTIITGAVGSNVTGIIQNSATSNLTLSNASNAYTGSTTISAGTILISGGGTIGNSNLVLAGGTLDITGATTGLTLANTQSVTGNGTLVTTGKAFTLNGTLAAGSSAPGLVNVTGSFSLGGGATSNFEINGTSTSLYDRLVLGGGGILAVGGTLNLATGYPAQLGDSVTLFTAPGGFSGSFASIAGNDIGGGLSWDTTSLLVNGTLVVVPEPGTWMLVALGGLVLVAARLRAKKTA